MTIQELRSNNLILFDCISGSKAYGLDTPTSDTDLKGVFYLPKDHFYGMSYISQVNNESNDEVYYEVGRFIELLANSNPNALELLATPDDCILYKAPVMNLLNLEIFLSKKCKETFAGYATTQIQKARGYKKKVVTPVGKERKSILDFCYVVKNAATMPLKTWLQQQELKQSDCGLSSLPHAKDMYALYHSKGNHYNGIMANVQANDVSLSSIAIGEIVQAYLFFNKSGYSFYCKEYRAYWDWVANRNEERFQNNLQHGKDYDAKNMMHTIRLLHVVKDLFNAGQLIVKRANRDELLSIKAGNYHYDDLLIMAEQLMQDIEVACKHSPLQDEINRKTAERALIRIRAALYD